MDIKGTAVKTTPEFVRERFGDRFQEWIELLPDSSRLIIEQPIYATSWYSLMDSVIVPTQKVGDLFYGGDHTLAAYELGRYSAETALKGIYKIFVRVSSPHFVLSRASSIFSAYYQPAEVRVIETTDKKAVLQFSKFAVDEQLIMHRIAGWIEKTLEITLKSALQVDVENRENGTELVTRIVAEWN